LSLKSYGYLVSDGDVWAVTDFVLFESNIRNTGVWKERFERYGQYFVEHDNAGFVATPEGAWQVQKMIWERGLVEVGVFHSHIRHPANFSRVDFDPALRSAGRAGREPKLSTVEANQHAVCVSRYATFDLGVAEATVGSTSAGAQPSVSAIVSMTVVLTPAGGGPGCDSNMGGGGKIHLIEAGVFAEVDVALSSHPAANRTVIPNDSDSRRLGLAMIGFRYTYYGKAAHAAVNPHDGINALNAVLRLFSGIDTLRQHLRDDVRIHGVITDGGKAPNVVPDFAAANFMLRSRDREYLKVVVDKVRQVAEGAALETGARLEVLPYYPFPTPRGTHVMYENARRNAVLNRIARANADAAGLVVHEPSIDRNMGGASSDFGNISQIMPAEAIRFAVSEQLIPGHSLAMRDAAITDLAHNNALAVAKTLALTALDVLADPAALDDVCGDFAGTNENP
jgi:metal-dependent amidase/aminoacylase/carboxypeptidase family protein